MSTLTLTSFTPPNCQITGGNITLRIYYEHTFVASDGTLVLGGAFGSQDFYKEIACSIVGDVLTVPTFDLITTDDPQPQGSAVCLVSAVLYQGSTQLDTVWSQWVIPVSLAPATNIAALAVFQLAVQLTYPQPYYLDRNQIVALILDIAPGNVSGDLTQFSVPRADSATQLVDGLAVDNGTDFSVQSIGTCQFGDYNVVQNGSFISVNDALTGSGGRTNIFAGGTGGVEYAGVSADCSLGAGEISVQSTGVTNLYGHDQITVIGDGESNQNGTQVVVNDPLRMVIQSAVNQVPNDPSLNNEQLCFYLDQASDKLMVRVRYNDGTYKSGEVALT